MKMRYILSIFLILSSIVLLQTCIVKPDFSEVPEIYFEGIQKISLNTDGIKSDSIIISVHFKDGNGDLGLGSGDTLSPYQEKNSDGTPNPFFYNYFVTMEKKTSTGYTPIVFTGPNLNGRFPVLNTESKAIPIEGTLRRGINIYLFSYPVINIPKNSYVRFKIQIADKALNKSNTITTDSLLVNTD